MLNFRTWFKGLGAFALESIRHSGHCLPDLQDLPPSPLTSFPRTPPCSRHSSHISRTFLLSLKHTQHTLSFEPWQSQVPLSGRFSLITCMAPFLTSCSFYSDVTSSDRLLTSALLPSPLAVKTVVPNPCPSACLSVFPSRSFILFYPALFFSKELSTFRYTACSFMV